MSGENNPSGHDLTEVDRVIHEPARYNIMALLYVIVRADFLFVKNQTGLTPGNLSSHLTKLDEAGYVFIEKTFVGRTPRTFLKLTDAGRDAFAAYRERMKELFNQPVKSSAVPDKD